MDTSLSNLWEMVKNRESWHAAVHGVTESRTVLSDYCCYNTFHGRQFFHEPRGKGGDDLGVTEAQ